MWNGWASLGGTELFNATRTKQYAEHMGIRWLKGRLAAPDLPLVLGHGERYTSPLQDDAPWVDPDVPESWQFLGAYPLGVSGIEDSTREAELIEFTTDGGVSGRIRHATKAPVFNVALVATSEAGAEYGLKWLRQATLGAPCFGSDPFGVDLCYLASEPILGEDDPDVTDTTACILPLIRTLRRVQIVKGPTVIAKQSMSHGELWTAQFAASVGVPWEFGSPVEIIEGFLGAGTPLGVATDLDSAGQVVGAEACVEPIWSPVYDPMCPALVAPPSVPDVPMGCFDLPSTWRRRSFTIPADEVPLWSSMTPVITLSTGATETRMVRLRFYSHPDLPGDPAIDPCGYCGDIVVSWIPANSQLVIDGSDESVRIVMAGGVVRGADTLVFGSDRKPFSWPSLSCGFAYVVTVDTTLQGAPPVVDLTMVPRAA